MAKLNNSVVFFQVAQGDAKEIEKSDLVALHQQASCSPYCTSCASCLLGCGITNRREMFGWGDDSSAWSLACLILHGRSSKGPSGLA